MLTRITLVVLALLSLAAAPPTTRLSKHHTITMYSAAWCGSCRDAARYLTCAGLPFVQREIDKDPAAERDFAKLKGDSMPLMFVDGLRMDGYQEKTMIEMLGKGESERARERLMACLKR